MIAKCEKINKVMEYLYFNESKYFIHYLENLNNEIKKLEEEYKQFFFRFCISDIPEPFTPEYHRRKAEVTYLQSLKNKKVVEYDNFIDMIYATYCY